MATKKPQLDQTDLVEQLPLACAHEDAAVAFLEEKRWPDGACCPTCGCTNVYSMKDRKSGERNRRFLWKCREKLCGRMFTVRTGTILEESLIPCHKWVRALWECSTAKNGCSALELSRRLQVTYKTALFVLHRIRHAMAPSELVTAKLAGEVEVDETYVGPRKPRYPNGGKNRARTVRGTHKQPVVAMVEKGGRVNARVVPDVSSHTLRQAMKDCIDPSAHITTDEGTGYWGTSKHFASHKTVNHRTKEYVKSDGTTTNTIEGYFSRVKRCLNGTWHAVSRQHLHRYLAHTSFLYNTRMMNDGERTMALLDAMKGKRLMYRDPAERQNKSA